MQRFTCLDALFIQQSLKNFQLPHVFLSWSRRKLSHLNLTSPPPNPSSPQATHRESTLIGVDVFKFILQLSGSFILPVVAANGCITTGSGLEGPPGCSRLGGSPAQT